MATTVYTEPELYQLIIAYLSGLYPGKRTGPLSFLGDQARAVAQVVSLIQVKIQQADKDAVPVTEIIDGVLKSRCSREALDNWAFLFALPSNKGASIYGRNGAQVAYGGAGLAVGTAGTIVPTGALLTDPSGLVQVELTAGVTIPVGGSISCSLQASSPGYAGNLPVGTVLTWVSPPAGLASTLTLTTALQNGYDEESDLLLIQRLIRTLQARPMGGTVADYRVWGESVTDSDGRSLGIDRAYPFPKRNGIGSVDLVLTIAGSGQGRDPGATRTAAAQVFVNARKPDADTIRILRPYFPSGQALRVKAKIVPRPRGAFDWLDSSGVGVALTAGTTTSVSVLTVGLPTGLALAIASGSQPRLQIPLTTLSPLPYQRRVVNSAVNGANTVLTLDSALPAAPGVGTVIYAGGSAVDSVALAVLSLIDSIGPSRASGYAPASDQWKSLVTIGDLADAVLGAKDAVGELLVAYSPSVGSGVGITIAVGVGAFTAADFITYDNAPPNGPQFPELAQVIVLEAV